MFALLHNWNPSIAPAHSSLCVAMGSGCVSETTSFHDEAMMISKPSSFMSKEFDSDKGLTTKKVAAPKWGGWRMDHGDSK